MLCAQVMQQQILMQYALKRRAASALRVPCGSLPAQSATTGSAGESHKCTHLSRPLN